MAEGIDDQRTSTGRRDTKGSDSDRGYGARDSQRESGRDKDPDRGAKGDVAAAPDSPEADRRTDAFGGRSDQPGDAKAGWRAVGAANPAGRIGGEDEKPGDGDPLGNGVR